MQCTSIVVKRRVKKKKKKGKNKEKGRNPNIKQDLENIVMKRKDLP